MPPRRGAHGRSNAYSTMAAVPVRPREVWRDQDPRKAQRLPHAWKPTKSVLMKTPASILRIPVHAVIGMLPIGIWTFAQFSDFMFLYVGGREWIVTAFYAYAGGTALALVAAVPGLVDHASLLERRARALSFFHMLSSALVIVLMAISTALRWDLSPASVLAMLLANVAFLFLIASAALGLYLVHVHAVGVSTDTESRVSEVPTGVGVRAGR
jgi:uncharacterized membrane protein